MIFIFCKKPDGTVFEDNQSITTMECNATELPEVVSHFEDFLRGCGFIVDGHLGIMEDKI